MKSLSGPRLKALSKALFFLKFRPRSEAEIRWYLNKKGVAEAEIDEVIARLKRIKLINDVELVKFWMRRRDEGSLRASKVIKYELKKLGVDVQLIDQVLGDQRQADQLRAKRLVEKMSGKERKKLVGYLARRGFGWETIKSVIDEEFKKH